MEARTDYQQNEFGKIRWPKFKQNINIPLFITITCEFSRFDNPSRPTAGEYTYWNPKVVQLP
jgi:hypothetical protein